MKELKCPNCNHVFQVDDEVFNSLAAQVRTESFNDELQKAATRLRDQAKAETELAIARKEQEMKAEIDKRDKKLAEQEANNRMVEERLKEAEERKRLELAATRTESDAQLTKSLAEKDAEKREALAEKDAEIARLKQELSRAEDTRKLAILNQQRAADLDLKKKEREITELKLNIEIEKRDAENDLNKLRELHTLELREKDATIELYKNFKARMSTKGIGESLEIHCSNEFESVRGLAFPNAQFGKDNEVVEGTKGDFIFRDFIDGEEYISIMFEMKNEADTTAAGHRNEEFFAKLHRDRCKKNCEFAVLVSMLEPENDLYNKGIVDVSHKFDKMFVVRPQFFLSIIGLLTKGARNAFAYKRKLAAREAENISFVNFRQKLSDIQDGIFKNYEEAHKDIENSLKTIDNSIKNLTALRDNLLKWERHMRLASNKAGGLTVRKLTHGNPTVRKAIDDAAKQPESEDTDDTPLLNMD